MDYQIKCEYCGQQASPSLDLICMHELHSEVRGKKTMRRTSLSIALLLLFVLLSDCSDVLL